MLSQEYLCAFSFLALTLGACGSPNTSQQQETQPVASQDDVSLSSSETDTIANETEPSADPAYAFVELAAPYNEADYALGARTAKLCQACHTLEQGGPNLVGPNLFGMFGQKIGSKAGYEYSKAAQESDIVWSAEVLDEWLANPRDFLPGNKMSFTGVRREDDRVAVIAYLLVTTDSQTQDQRKSN